MRNLEKKLNLKTNYSSQIIQDELINICADVVKEIIVKDIEDVKVFGIMCDKARCYKQEQMALCVKYVKNLDVIEKFLDFIDFSKNQDAETAQSYDGANVMSGKFNGLQNKIKNQYPHAIYTHCMAHKMNLIVIDMCKYVKNPVSLYVHFSHPPKNQKLTEILTKLGIKHTKIIRLSDARWNYRYRNIESVKNSYKAIIQVLEE
ncbi:protein ZBED8-like [Sipha flava]|uniref:Protein ZBED8-like n=1 Tax=Sipha flava TaxID=143950 RepID=A0A8B8F7H6_9HEMI|nr:protein ZBED8-like [Sipha flava]